MSQTTVVGLGWDRNIVNVGANTGSTQPGKHLIAFINLDDIEGITALAVITLLQWLDRQGG